jgi:hypothetical protein
VGKPANAPRNMALSRCSMSFPMDLSGIYNPRNREPRPHEAALFSEIYTDETSHTDHDFLVIGGLMIPRAHVAQFERDVINARLPRLPLTHSNGEPRKLAWGECTKGDLETYKKVVDVFFRFVGQPTNTLHRLIFHCSVVDCRIPGRNYSTGVKGQKEFNKQIYFHHLAIGRRYRKSLFHSYPDYRSTKMTMREMQAIIGHSLKKEDPRDWPFRRIQFRRSWQLQALQVSDVFIGAVAYKLNGWYAEKNAAAHKRELCDYIINKAKARLYCRRGEPKKKDWGQFRIWVRGQPEE